MTNVIRTEEYKGYKIEIGYMGKESPANSVFNLGEIVCANYGHEAVDEDRRFATNNDALLYIYTTKYTRKTKRNSRRVWSIK